ncbi:hypothetical protein K4A76_23545 [Pseudomonas sp. NEEL19]|uniref:hypothetical protein n=1 Tax=Pseudomonas sp. NEEL19 TaxID=2867409 RepID=UPI0023678C46|nr:hypothetical protein [Pseudomonas sp. NEEL19]WDM59371.1 hypothetical protein K4A76_23545 [Pseudomonas sp. NEEL19]
MLNRELATSRDQFSGSFLSARKSGAGILVERPRHGHLSRFDIDDSIRHIEKTRGFTLIEVRPVEANSTHVECIIQHCTRSSAQAASLKLNYLIKLHFHRGDAYQPRPITHHSERSGDHAKPVLASSLRRTLKLILQPLFYSFLCVTKPMSVAVQLNH